MLYFLSPGIRIKNFVLLVTSLFFYAWGEMELVFLMILSSLFNYGIGLWIQKQKTSTFPLFIGVTANVLILIYFKYVGLLVGGIDWLLETHWNDGIDIHLPIGISFFTFQSISYLVDLKRGDASIQKNPFKLMLYISLFPQLIAGPIVRYQEIEKELSYREHSLLNFVNGAKRFCVGLAKKVLIANVMGEIGDEILAIPPAEMYYATSWAALAAYTIYIYFDFSGYSDMAIGLGKMFGFNFPENFNYPYISRSIREFWKRWHITLSEWFKDYLFIPLGGSKKGVARVYFNLFMVFFITGMWHGDKANYIIWGLVHGFFIIIERLGFTKFIDKSRVLGHLYFIAVYFIAWIFFLMPDWSSAMGYYASMFTLEPEVVGLYLSDLLDREYIVIFVIGVILSMPVRNQILKVKSKIEGSNIALEFWDYCTSLFYLLLLVLSAMSIASSTYNPFIYFRF